MRERPDVFSEALLQWMEMSGGAWICSRTAASGTGCIFPAILGFGRFGSYDPEEVFDSQGVMESNAGMALDQLSIPSQKHSTPSNSVRL